MLLSKHCSMEMNDSQPEDTTAKRLSEAVSDQVRFPSNGNDTVKQEMAKALLVQGISEEAVCRLLHIDSEMLPDKSVKAVYENEDVEAHYNITPYTFKPRVGRKLLVNPFVDMGQGILNCIEQLYMSHSRQGEKLL